MTDYANSCLSVARYHLNQGGRDYELAKVYLERVLGSNSPSVMQATELMKKVKTAIITRQAATELEAQPQQQAQAGSAAPSVSGMATGAGS